MVLVIFLLSNRHAANVQFWPFGYVLTLPLGAIILAVAVLGFLLGLLFHLPNRVASGRRAKRAERRNAELEARLPPTNTGLPPAIR